MANRNTNNNRSNRPTTNPEENKNELDTTNEAPTPESEVPTNEPPTDVKDEAEAPEEDAPPIVDEGKNETEAVLDEIKSGISDVAQDDIVMDTKLQKQSIKPDELIPCRSMVRGGFNWRCAKSGISYRWNGMGHVEYIQYDDVYQMFTNAKHYLTKPFIIVEDKRVVSNFKLLDVYKNIASVNRLEKAVNNVGAMREICKLALQVNMRDLITERLSQMRSDGLLNNIDVITTAEEILKCEIIKK